MRRLAFLSLLIAPVTALAMQDPIDRIDAFQKIWQGLLRPADTVSKSPFLDLPVDHPASAIVRYAVSRGLIEESDDRFSPYAPLTMEQMLVWLFRTRNVAPPAEITPETLPTLLARYPLAKMDTPDERSTLVTETMLESFTSALDTMLRDEDHEVSLYGEEFQGAGTAFGETFDLSQYTAAHRTYPYNTLVRVTNERNGKSIIVRINDRGPFVEGRDMDLSVASFTAIEERSRGVLHARFERLGDVRMVPACTGTSPRAQRLRPNIMLTPGIPHATRLGSEVVLRSRKPFVVRWVERPNAGKVRLERWVTKDEAVTLTFDAIGVYRMQIDSASGNGRIFEVEVMDCGKGE